MEQIYYTQCPMGYGLGASNGFQIKRLGAGYPPSGDVRHLAMRAFLPGTTNLAPGSLRYRRDGQLTEIAWLTPRPREYETERGLWGRPGGHFAHGMRLEPEELAALANWPAGLFDRPFWRRSDPEPSRGRRPDDLALGLDDLMVPPRFREVSARIDLEVEPLAMLLAAVSEAVRSGRTLFLIDEPQRLGFRIAALTFAFPKVMRPELTFSTYHDRPEELSGFRIQGTAPTALTNRAMLAGMGLIADLSAGRFEPSASPPTWAWTLAGWLTRRDDRAEADWTGTDERASRCRRPTTLTEQWSDAWLDGLIGQAEATRGPRPLPSTPDDWNRLTSQVVWASGAELSNELVEVLGPSWWRSIAKEPGRIERSHKAFWGLLLSASLWSGQVDATAWGEAASPYWSRLSPPLREEVLSRSLKQITRPDWLARFLDGLIRSVGTDEAQEALDWLQRRPGIDARVLVPLQARVAVAMVRDRGRTVALEHVLQRAAALSDTMTTVLDLIADEADRGHAVEDVAVAVAEVMEQADDPTRGTFEDWAIRRRVSGGSDWFRPYLKRLFVTDINRRDWDAIRARSHPALRPWLARSTLEVADDPTSVPEAFDWAIESLLLPIPAADRPEPGLWAARYLDRIGSPYRLATRLRGRRGDALVEWLSEARKTGDLVPRSQVLLDDAGVIRQIIEGDRNEMPDDDLLARLPENDRGPVLGLLLENVAEGQFDEAGAVLERCARAWPGAFDAGSKDLDDRADPLAELLLQFVAESDRWLEALGVVLARLGVDPSNDRTWSPHGLPAAVLAATTRSAITDYAWALRSAVLARDLTFPILARDIGRALGTKPVARAADELRNWDRTLDKGRHSARFFEVALNACDDQRLAVIVPEFARELETLGSLRWWAGGDGPGDGDPLDLREAFAIRSPMAPMPTRNLTTVDRWLHNVEPRPSTDPSVPIPVDSPGSRVSNQARTAQLSAKAEARWRCLRALSSFHWSGKSNAARWDDVITWTLEELPLGSLDPDDRYRFLAWALAVLDMPEASDSTAVERFAFWLVRKADLRDVARMKRWIDRIGVEEQSQGKRRNLLVRALVGEMMANQ